VGGEANTNDVETGGKMNYTGKSKMWHSGNFKAKRNESTDINLLTAMLRENGEEKR